MLLGAPLDGIVLVGPVCLQVFGYGHGLQVCVTHLAKRGERGAHIGALFPGAATAIDDDRAVLRLALDRFLQHLNTFGLRTRPGINRAGDVGGPKENGETDIEEQRRPDVRRNIFGLDQVLRLPDIAGQQTGRQNYYREQELPHEVSLYKGLLYGP